MVLDGYRFQSYLSCVIHIFVPSLPKPGGNGKSAVVPGSGQPPPPSHRPISPPLVQCGINDEELVSLSVRDLNRQLKMRGLNRDEIVTMKQR